MSRILTGNNMINSVRKRTFCPDDTSVFTDVDILEIVDEEMQVQVLEKLQVLHGDNLTTTIDITRDGSGSYNMPSRALGNKLRDVSLISGSQIYELAQISVGALPDYNNGNYSEYDMDLFYIENNKIKIVAPERQYDSVRMRFHLRPNYLTKVEEAGIVSSLVTDDVAGTLTIGLSQVGKNFTSTKKYDIIGANSPNRIHDYDLDPVSLTTGTTGIIVFNLSELSNMTDISVGDYVSIAGETPVPNIPTEMHPLLAQAAAVNILESLGDTQGLTNANARMDKMSRSVQTLIDNRVELAPKKIRPRNGVLASRSKTGRRN